jgi:Zn-dependent M28 family amino/carboxypeptidase
LENVCAFGRRFSTSRGMMQQQDYLRKHFESLGVQVFMQPFVARNPRDGRQAELANMIVRFHPHRSKRLLICCHYDTRPFPDLDRRNPHGVFIGANDGGSGVAILCELGRLLAPPIDDAELSRAAPGEGAWNGPPKTDDGKYGIDFAFFDGEEFVYVARRDPMFLGSTHFSNEYVRTGSPPQSKVSFEQRGQRVAVGPADSRYVFAILIDMIGDKNLQIFYEGNSLRYAPRLTKSIWDVAARMEIKEFVPKQKHELRDDHLPLNQIARIPTCDIIDFDFPSARRKHAYWHTEADVVKNCSARSLGIVGSVLLQWLNEMQQLAQSHPSH